MTSRLLPGRGRHIRTRGLALVIAAVAVAGWILLGPIGVRSGAGGGAFAGPPDRCTFGDTLTPHRDPADWARTLVDTEYMLAPADVPPDLVPVTTAGIRGGGKVRSLVIDDLRALAAAARKAGVTFAVKSGYRSYDQQVAAFASLERAYGREYALASVARAGHSEHQLGTTIDIEGGESWFARHASRFGFVMSYPPGRSPEWSCYKPEPWHFRYFGRETAQAIENSGVTAREWLWDRQQVPVRNP